MIFIPFSIEKCIFACWFSATERMLDSVLYYPLSPKYLSPDSSAMGFIRLKYQFYCLSINICFSIMFQVFGFRYFNEVYLTVLR
jgi:hypothetical protein